MKITPTEKAVLQKMEDEGGRLDWSQTSSQETQALMRLVRKGFVIRIGEEYLDRSTYWKLS